ncbi:MAG TPA: hypothetical protein VL576_00445 [Candidatus Paceibacterota bacterium]|jgi:hypothetical protein|nr:hypothetical protein [Candidatus Paceibacterota bacterium]
MITPALLSYIQQQQAAGKSKDKIKSELLLAGGWQESEVDAAFATLQTGPYKTSVGSKIGSFFLTLFIVIIVLGALAFVAQKYLGSTVSSIEQNIVAVFSSKQNQAPAPQALSTTTNVQPVVQSPAVSDQGVSTTSTPEAGLTTITVPATASAQVTPSIPATPIKCKTNDSDCLMQAVTSCESATETQTTSVTSPSKESSTRLYTIVGPQNNQCSFKFTVKSDTNKKFSAKSASCLLSTSDLTSLLGNWTAGDFYTNTGVNLYGQCSGTYFNN